MTRFSALLHRECVRLRRWRREFTPQVVVLLYHRVADTPCDPWQLSVTPERFAEHLEVVMKTADVLSADDMVQGLGTGRLPRRTIVLTFDDGYADNLFTAKPLLDRVHLSATLFLTSGAVDSPYEFWWDELERVFLQPGTLPVTLRLEINGEPRTWSLGPDAVWSVPEWERRRDWRANTPPRSARERVYYEIWDGLRALPAREQHEVLEALARWSGRPRQARPSHRALTAADVRQLASGGRFHVGAHTVTHPSLPALSREAQTEEVRVSRAQVEGLLGSTVRHFAYPYGDYSNETSDLTREEGFASAFTTDEGMIREDGNRWQLPRYKVEDWDAADFAARLDAMFEPSSVVAHP